MQHWDLGLLTLKAEAQKEFIPGKGNLYLQICSQGPLNNISVDNTPSPKLIQMNALKIIRLTWTTTTTRF